MQVHYELTRSQRLFSIASIAAAAALVVVLALRTGLRADLTPWWAPFACGLGILAADFGSGLVHWSADTWGSDDLPLVGHRLLVPFRVHHVNPDDFLRRSFIDVNGDVAFIGACVLAVLVSLPLTTSRDAVVAMFGLGFCGVGMLTNQIHQWAHMPSPPAVVRLLQDCGLILGRSGHAAHHARPYDASYCITTGWCNRPLEAIGFFRRAEWIVRRITGARPREDDVRYEVGSA